MGEWPQVVIGGVIVDLLDGSGAHDLLMACAASVTGPPLAVMSANLDHLHHFGRRAPFHGAVGEPSIGASGDLRSNELTWLNLIDGVPIAIQARRLTGSAWPRLAGSDLIDPLLDSAEKMGLSVGFLGGAPETHDALRLVLNRTRPALRVAGLWAPERGDLSDSARSTAIAAAVRASGAQILVVGLGKPRQELWIAEYGEATGARLLLAFGAVVDFLAGRIGRAPQPLRRVGLEWAWRLALEPRRLARRYLVQGPPALLDCLHRDEAARTAGDLPISVNRPIRRPPDPGRFVGCSEPAEVAAIVVTYNNENDIYELVRSLRVEAMNLALRVIVVDNDSHDETTIRVQAHSDIALLSTGGNLGYAGAINRAFPLTAGANHVLTLNPDLTVEPGAITALVERARSREVGAVLPTLRNDDGSLAFSLRREPSVSRALGDAALGRRFPLRPGWASEVVSDVRAYEHAHPVMWGTGAAILVRRSVAEAVGTWDERYFLYSEEVDYCRRIRESGAQVWFEPRAVMTHRGGGSGTGRTLTALLQVNRIRYFRSHHNRASSICFAGAVSAASVLRIGDPGQRLALHALLSRRTRSALPHATPPKSPLAASSEPRLRGAVIVPAHNEASVITRTLSPLAPFAGENFEIIVVCNGCTDDTVEVAQSFRGVRVIETPNASKPGALNLGDAAATQWPRLYLDADVRISPEALADVFCTLETSDTIVAARPSSTYDTSGARLLVRSYYRARRRIPCLHQSMWGAGAYALSERARARFDEFPEVTADDLWIDQQFAPTEKTIVDTSDPITVITPRNAKGLIAITRRSYRGKTELADGRSAHGSSPAFSSIAAELLRSTRTPRDIVDSITYVSITLLSRTLAFLPTRRKWERDESSRIVAPTSISSSR